MRRSMSLRALAVLGAGLVASVTMLAGAAVLGLTSVLGGSATAGSTVPSATGLAATAGSATGGIATAVGATALSANSTPSQGARSAIPPAYLQAFEAAAASCPGLPWSVLAGIGSVETDFGADTQTSSAGAEVIYGWDGGLRHQRDEVVHGRGSLVSEGSLARGQGGGHSGFKGSPAHDDQTSSVASGVSI